MSQKGQPSSRPLSPHLQVWKFHPTMMSSILHRATGVANYLGVIVIVGWLFGVSMGPDRFEAYDAIFTSPTVQLILFGFTISILYHLINGIRHLVWDAGHGFSPKIADFWAWFAIVGSVVGAVAVWVMAGLVPFL